MNRHPYLVRASKMEMIDSSGRETMGGLDWLVVTVLIAAGVLSAFSPWSFFIGGRFTPLAQWTGYGKMHSPSGGDYGLFLRLAHHQSDDIAGSFAAKPNLRGSAILCTPQGDKYEYRLEGTVRNAWLQTEGRPTGLRLVTLDGEPQHRDLRLQNLGLPNDDLRGVWRHGNLVLDDNGSASSRVPSASPKTRHGKHRPARKGDHPAIVVSYGNLAAFNNFCENEIARTSQARMISKPSPATRQ
jgi:hypothetical protein